MNTIFFKEQSQRPEQDEERVVLPTHQTCSVAPWSGNRSPGQQVILEACFNTAQTGYADLNKPFEQVASHFWYSYLCGRKLKELCPEHSLLSSRTTLGTTTRRKTKLLLCRFLLQLYSSIRIRQYLVKGYLKLVQYQENK